MYKTLRPFIYRLTPEQAHHLTIAMLRLGGSVALARVILSALFRTSQPCGKIKLFGVEFPNPIGMAAGYDKDGQAWRGLACLGFGHIEVGTVTPRAQAGNPPPRLFRLVEDQAVINRMGFNNRGAEYLAKQLRGTRPNGVVIGVNIGKNKITPLEEAHLDYLYLLRKFAPIADYLAVNISSPNTPGLRTLQSRKALEGILRPLADERKILVNTLNRNIPILVKLAPDLSDEELDDALCAIIDHGIDGVIMSNTTISRPDLLSKHREETGGLSGAPLRRLSTVMVKKVADRLQGKLPVIASGGVMCPADAKEKFDSGASLVQLYTGLIYSGPGLVKDIINSL